MNTIEECARAHRTAAKQLMECVQRTYPHGTKVTVNTGRSRIEAEVIGHSFYINEPDSLTVKNTATGKTRRVCATSEFHDIQLVNKP